MPDDYDAASLSHYVPLEPLLHPGAAVAPRPAGQPVPRLRIPANPQMARARLAPAPASSVAPAPAPTVDLVPADVDTLLRCAPQRSAAWALPYVVPGRII